MYRHTLVNHFLERSAERFPGKTALVHEGERLTYAQIDQRAGSLAAFLRNCGVKRGDRVAIFMDNCPEAVISLFAALKAGAAFLLINHTTKADKFEYILNNSRASALVLQGDRAGVVHRERLPHLRTIVSVDDGGNGPGWSSYEKIMHSGAAEGVRSPNVDLDLASVIYTSGSTGFPKGVMLSHLNMVSAAHSISTYLENRNDDVIINVLPLSFDYGLYQVLMGFRIGGTVVLEKSFAYPFQVVQTMVRERVTGFPGVPTIFALLLRIKDIDKLDWGSLRYITNTAAALPVSHIRRLREVFPQARLYSMYGLTECKRVSYLPPEQLDVRPTSVGRGMPNEEVYIIDESGNRLGPGEIGELVVRGSNVMLGYWEKPEETAERLRPGDYPGERVLNTGDLFRMDDEGYLYFVARKDDIIKSKGEKVSPKEIENVLYGIEGVLEAAVIGVPDEILGQAIKAFVALEQGAKLTERDIMRHCSRHLETYMLPKYVEIMPSLPKTATGKIRKQDLKEAATSSGAATGQAHD
jgi:long-chain acyl-CoA synthetase